MKIKINGIFHKYNNVVELDKRLSIFIGENGVGKSTTLKIFMNLLDLNFCELAKYNFENIELVNDDGILIKIERSDLFPSNESIFVKNDIFNTTSKKLLEIKDKELYIKCINSIIEKSDAEFIFNSITERKNSNRIKQLEYNLISICVAEYYMGDVLSNNDKELFVKLITLSNVSRYIKKSAESMIYDYNGSKIYKSSSIEKYINKILNIFKNYSGISNKNLYLNMVNDYDITYYNNSQKYYTNSAELTREKNEFLNFKDYIDYVRENNISKYVRISPLKYNLINDIKEKRIDISRLIFKNFYSKEKISNIINNYYEFIKNYPDDKHSSELFAKAYDKAKKYHRDGELKPINKIAAESLFLPFFSKNSYFDFSDKGYDYYFGDVIKSEDLNEFEMLFWSFDKSIDEPSNEKIIALRNLFKKYFTNKKIFVCPVGIFIQTEFDQKFSDDLMPEELSDGERKLITLFSTCILGDIDTLFLDEPETSLSIVWQKEFLEDLLNNSNLKRIIVATQSPYIVPEDSMDDIICLPGDVNE